MQIKKILLNLIFISLATSCGNEESFQTQLESLRDSIQQKIDSNEKKHEYKARLYLLADSIILNYPFGTAKQKIDSLIHLFPNDDQFRLYKGDLYMHYSNAQKAIEQYNIAISNGYLPIALEKRATAYIITKKFNDAVIDLKQAATHNSDYYYSVGYTYELMEKYDSALSYFELYLTFSGNKNGKFHIDSLKQKLSQ